MTTFMKIEAVIYFVLKLFGYAIGILGVFGIFGFEGSLKCDTITIAQFLMYELHAFLLIGLSFVVYIIREIIREDFIRRNRILRRKAKLSCK